MSPRRYAEGTVVPIENSKSEAEHLLRRHGATGMLTMWDDDAAQSVVQFRLADRIFKLVVEDPDLSEYAVSPGGVKRNRDQQASAANREHMRRWRSLVLVIKAKLELIEGGGSTPEREFMADLMLPDGSTLGDNIGPEIDAAYKSGKMPQLMLPKG